MPDCRKSLTMDTVIKTAATLGEMCHIVGEKLDAARGKNSKMTPSERNTYSNLILLCRHHHVIIDRNEKAYPIEILHKIKDDHEIWVDENLSSKTFTPEELVYSSLIDLLSIKLRLDQWNWFVDNAVRQF